MPGFFYLFFNKQYVILVYVYSACKYIQGEQVSDKISKKITIWNKSSEERAKDIEVDNDPMALREAFLIAAEMVRPGDEHGQVLGWIEHKKKK